MQIPKEFIEFCEREEIKETLQNFSGRYYWIKYIEQYNYKEDEKIFIKNEFFEKVVRDFHPFLIILVSKYLSLKNIQGYNKGSNFILQDYKEITKEEYELYKILEEIECQEYQK